MFSLISERFCDVTLYCSPSFATQVPNKDTVEPEKIRGVSLRAHRVVLAACSELLAALLGAHEAHGEPVLVIDGAEPRHLRALLDYMYTGEMSVHHSQLASLLKTAEELRIKGLTDIRWSNKDEPPDCESGVVTTTTMNKSPIAEKQQEKTSVERRTPEFRHERPTETRPERPIESRPETTETRFRTKQDSETSVTETSNKETKSTEKFNVNGGPPPLIKLPLIEKTSPVKRETDTKSPSPKRKRLTSGTEHTDEGSLTPKTEGEWQHGNLDISAERVVSWGAGDSGEWSRDASDDEWADAPADIGSFLSTSLRVDGDNSAEDSEDSTAHTGSSSTVTTACPAGPAGEPFTLIPNPNPTGKSKQIDPRFTDVVKLNDYLQHGRRPQFWEESYVKKRYVFSVCSTRELWHAGPADVLERLQRGEVTREAAALALGVSPANLAAYVLDLAADKVFPALGVSPANLAAYVLDLAADKEFEPIPIEMDSSVKMRTRTVSGATAPKPRKSPHNDRQSKKSLGNVTDEESGAASAHDKCQYTQAASSGKWPSIRVASIESLREASASGASPSPSPSALMRTRPDLTIVAARRRDEDN
ncbi:Longitudinals lacking protein, isoforms J/P/Q/S/Z [Papilio machaon]|uniref:Longitudinals lacking protein, isoforms J/P/Q/S/Z n=1 Tax=Papilio machaon TaxID=76193 RepID=A0A194RE46_PAPMA|nr:Longitudinals lacking protein, isoforms J/P/Q/S/Z [Papilio machaon]